MREQGRGRCRSRANYAQSDTQSGNLRTPAREPSLGNFPGIYRARSSFVRRKRTGWPVSSNQRTLVNVPVNFAPLARWGEVEAAKLRQNRSGVSRSGGRHLRAKGAMFRANSVDCVRSQLVTPTPKFNRSSRLALRVAANPRARQNASSSPAYPNSAAPRHGEVPQADRSEAKTGKHVALSRKSGRAQRRSPWVRGSAPLSVGARLSSALRGRAARAPLSVGARLALPPAEGSAPAKRESEAEARGNKMTGPTFFRGKCCPPGIFWRELK